MGTLNYHCCIACRKGWVAEKEATRRVDWCKYMLAKYPKPEDWKRVRFSDEVHFGLGPKERLHVIRKPGERYCKACMDIRLPPDQCDSKKVHAWGAVGYGFKSDLVFYEIPSNTNGKMTQSVYLNEILEPVIGKWLAEGHNFVLEEDRDSGHGCGERSRYKNQVQLWKESHGLEHYFNASSAPDLSPIENCWQVPKSMVKRFASMEPDWIEELVSEAWYESLKQETIDKWVLSMPERLQRVIDHDGQISGF